MLNGYRHCGEFTDRYMKYFGQAGFFKMSYFATISFNKKLKNNLINLLMEQCDNSFVGKICKGNKLEFSSYFLKIYFHNGSKELKKDEINNFLNIIEKNNDLIISFNLLLHWYSGEIYNEKFDIIDTQKISYQNFKKIFPNLEEDIRYKILL